MYMQFKRKKKKKKKKEEKKRKKKKTPVVSLYAIVLTIWPATPYRWLLALGSWQGTFAARSMPTKQLCSTITSNEPLEFFFRADLFTFSVILDHFEKVLLWATSCAPSRGLHSVDSARLIQEAVDKPPQDQISSVRTTIRQATAFGD